ncbi:MAG: Gldg family protein [Candidatus Hydrogenedentes bacterium]|nr:Gldg family protein [Candidatus Hydrogenedentota bacterium]
MTIFRRDLAAYFTSPIGYIFMIVFVTISVGLYITSFFTFPVADMRPFFANFPIMFCVFIPAVTMRVWAEDRKDNTWEMLLTFPMKAWELVLGKFAATLAFFAITLSATFTIPVMISVLGNPDIGPIVSGYLGSLLLGAYFLSIGIFFSGFFKDQILAFVVTLLTCFSIFLLGTNFIAAYLDDVFTGLGTTLSELVGLSSHFATFTRGVIEIADVLYFVAWTGIFLLLNALYIDGRNRRGVRIIFSGAVAVCLAIGFLANWLIADTSLGRFDMTEGNIFTVSDASKNILKKVDTPVQVKLYITPKGQMPTGMTSLERDITDKLDELRVASGGNLQYSVINLEVSEAISSAEISADDEAAESDEEVLEKRLLDKGVEPFPVEAMSENQITSKLVYSSIGVAYKDKQEEILPQIMPQSLLELEYRLVSTIYKLTREKDPVVALVAPKEAVNIAPEMRRIFQQIGRPVPQSEDPYDILERFLDYEKYEIRRVDLTSVSTMPEEYDTLVVINPRAFNERQRWEVNRALLAGKSVVMAVQTYEWSYQATSTGTSLNSREETPQVNELLQAYGLGVDEDFLMDINHVPLRVQSSANPLASLFGGGHTVNLPMHMLINNASMDQDTSITSRLSAVFYLWGTALTIDEEKLHELGLEAKTLMYTSDGAWKWPKEVPLTSASFERPSAGEGPYPLMVLVTGQFPDAFEGQERPAWPVADPRSGQFPPPSPPAEGPAGEITPAPGKLILIGCSEMFRKDFLQAGNLDLFINSIDAVTLGDDLINVRGRKPIDRLIDTPSSGTRQMWKFVNYVLASTAIALVGISVAMLRRRSRDAYTMAYLSAEE